jgi:hypothetical protein
MVGKVQFVLGEVLDSMGVGPSPSTTPRYSRFASAAAARVLRPIHLRTGAMAVRLSGRTMASWSGGQLKASQLILVDSKFSLSCCALCGLL